MQSPAPENSHPPGRRRLHAIWPKCKRRSQATGVGATALTWHCGLGGSRGPSLASSSEMPPVAQAGRFVGLLPPMQSPCEALLQATPISSHAP